MMLRLVIAAGVLLALAGTARADEPAAEVEPAGTVVVHPEPRPGCAAADGCDGATVVRKTVRLAVTRASAERALTEAELAERRLNGWLECEARADRLQHGDPRWFTALKYTAFGVALGGAFALGLVLAGN
jgi:hypothetical protein